MAAIEVPKQVRAEAVASLQRYFRENLDSALGELPASLLLSFFLEEVGPVVYNQAIADAQAAVQSHVADLHGVLFADAFQYWHRAEKKRKSGR